MTENRSVLPILSAALIGGVVGALIVSFVRPVPEPTGVTPHELAETEVRVLGDLERVDARVRSLEEALVALRASTADPDVAAALDAFRDGLRAELERVEARLGRAEEDLAEVAVGFVRVQRSEAEDQPLSASQQRFWAARSRDQDPGERFSALVILGAERTEIGVEVCLERLDERGEKSIVLWQALRNLGAFRERAAAARVAAFLDHEQAVVRAAAFDALRLVGAPESEYDPAAAPEERRAASEALVAWAERQ